VPLPNAQGRHHPFGLYSQPVIRSIPRRSFDSDREFMMVMKSLLY